MIAKVLRRLVNGHSIPLRFRVQLERIIFHPVEEADLGLVLKSQSGQRLAVII